MKSDKPKFNGAGIVDCADCPFEDGGCRINDCPTQETYAAAVKLAKG